MSKIIEVGLSLTTYSFKIGEELGHDLGTITNMEFVNPDRKSNDYAVRIETDTGCFAIIPNPADIIGKKSTGENNG